ncbi:MAG TPA: PQQ-binding-like beta-propeller repeat protein [Bryobacteraceae bacterium]|nr:PQQ-binding-like beta-propeller repeat protein [Bryobacteraceae bacterium]
MNRHPFLTHTFAITGALTIFAALGWAQRSPDLNPVPFRSADGKFTGWKLTIPGNRPLATPAVVDGKIYIGGGFGSHEFYAFDSGSGQHLWTYHTADDGPTAAVVEGRRIIFNTESCEIETLTTDGKPVWKKWLGDPLMSMPAVADGKVYMAYPNSRSDHRYYLAAFDLASGSELWHSPIAGEIITAPVVDEEKVYVSTVDGSLVSFDRKDGKQLWEERKNATSAPAVWKGQTFFSRREQTNVTVGGRVMAQQNEVVASKATTTAAAPVVDVRDTMRAADYLDYKKRAASPTEAKSQSLDASVGFAGASKGSANMAASMANLGQASVHGIWAYQGSKPFVDNGRLYSSMGNRVMSVDAKTSKVLWTRDLGRDGVNASLTPPAVVNGKVFVGTRTGEVRAMSEATGEVLWTVNVGEPVVFQPAVMNGRVYVPTESGSIICFETGDPHDDGWQMWGGNGAHNGLKKR